VHPAGNRTGDLSLIRRGWYHKTIASALLKIPGVTAAQCKNELLHGRNSVLRAAVFQFHSLTVQLVVALLFLAVGIEISFEHSKKSSVQKFPISGEKESST
jgi:hypothetical protein